MGSFGERLRREREMRGITINEISESTKISRRHLEALEKEDFESLPGGIFNKGFVRAYARYLGIDEEQAVADYSAASDEPAAPEDEFPLDIHHQVDPKLNPKRSTLPLVLALLALLAVLAVFWARTRSRAVDSAEGAGAQAGASNGISTTSPTQPRPDEAPPDKNASQATPVVNPMPSPAKTQENVASGAKSPAAERGFSVVVKAKEDSWVSLIAEGKTVLSRTLAAGEAQVVRAGSKVVLTTGNAGGVDVSFNGKALGALGSESQVRTLTFTPSGLVQ